MGLCTALVALAACGDGAPDPSGDPLTDSAVAVAGDTSGRGRSGVVPAPASGTATGPTPGDTTESVNSGPATGAYLAIEGEGLRIFMTSNGAARPIAFGSAEDEVIDLVTAVTGREARELGVNMDCAARYAVWDDGLTLWFSDGRFAGWAVRSGSNLTTAAGIGIGSTRAEVESVYVPQIGPSSLGTEFTAGGLAGLLDSPAQDATVTNLWAGAACIAR